MKGNPVIAYWLTNPEDRKTVGDFLRECGYSAHEITEPAHLSFPLDLLVIDGVSFAENKKTIAMYREKSPYFVPCLLVTTNEYVSYEKDNLVELVDMILYLPVEKVQLHATLRSLLRAHNYAVVLWEENQRYNAYMENILELLADHFGLYSLRFDKVQATFYCSKNLSILKDGGLRSFADLREIFHPEDWALVDYTFEEFFYTHDQDFADIQVRLRKDGEYRYTNMRWYVQRDEKKSPQVFDILLLDIEDLYSQQEELRTALEGQKTLIREIFHRTRNNMQTILSLLSLYKYRCGGAEGVFQDIEAKIRAMAKLHDMLYQGKTLTEFDVGHYIQEITVVISQIYERDIGWDLHLEENLFLSVDKGIALGIVITELIQNSFKHAFCEENHPRVRIVLKSEGEHLCLEYEDNGKWHEPEGDHTYHLGLDLITTMVTGTLRGTYQRIPGKNYHAMICFGGNTQKYSQ
ncbi:MAG: hypothetical protein N2314_07525 [Brevinematales bacterium]|nr:hypothetical protein [Brevinematales bacterium]